MSKVSLVIYIKQESLYTGKVLKQKQKDIEDYLLQHYRNVVDKNTKVVLMEMDKEYILGEISPLSPLHADIWHALSIMYIVEEKEHTKELKEKIHDLLNCVKENVDFHTRLKDYSIFLKKTYLRDLLEEQYPNHDSIYMLEGRTLILDFEEENMLKFSRKISEKTLIEKLKV